MTDRELISACRKLIGDYGTLRYCGGGICACVGCVNGNLTKKEYEHALTLPEVQEMMENPNLCHLDFITDADHNLASRLKRYKEKKHGKENKIDLKLVE